MTSMEEESVTTILCTSKQTRFHIGTPNYREAIAQKLIPGIPEETRIVILQQTDPGDVNTATNPEQIIAQPLNTSDRNVLEEVIERATARHEAQRELESLSRGIESADPLDAVRSLRKIRRERLQKDLFLKAKDAKLRSGARGMQARKALIAMEKTVAEFDVLYEEKDEEISPETLAKETSEAAEMLADLQLSIEPSKVAEVESRAKKLLAGLGFTEVAMLKPLRSASGYRHIDTRRADQLPGLAVHSVAAAASHNSRRVDRSADAHSRFTRSRFHISLHRSSHPQR
ncbi:hypothetical protein F5B21DRAFT_421329 [Xylaria acuta]|nr:hypothetical protein F5B21DRAFT_421329 [Xylaria acuta]